MEAFLEHLRERGCSGNTLDKYRRALAQLRAFLPQDGQLEADTLLRWREALLADGYAPRTVNACISAANSLLDFLGRRDLQLAPMRLPEGGVQPELTRGEYLRLLQTARDLGRERLYLLVKVFGGMGLQVQELPRLTAEAARAGRIALPGQSLRVPACLRAELLDYAAREQLASGPLFITRGGRPMSRVSVTASIRRLCRAAQVDEAKGNPRCLRRLCLATQAGIQLQMELLAEQTYDRLLEKEQAAVGWESCTNKVWEVS